MKNNNKGFSLVELIVVIAIMAILAAIAIPTFAHFITKANEASDAELLHNINYIFNAACVENGVDIKDVTAAEWDKTNKRVINVKVNGADNDDIEASFVTHFDLTEEEFKLIEEIIFDTAKHEFVDLATASEITLNYGDKGSITITRDQLNALKNSAFGEMESDELLGKVAFVTDLAASLMGDGGEGSTELELMLKSGDYMSILAANLGIDVSTEAGEAEFEQTYAALVADAAAKLQTNNPEKYAGQSASDTTSQLYIDAQNQIVANNAVLYSAQQSQEMGDIISILSQPNAKTTIANTIDSDSGKGLAQASAAYALYTAYAHRYEKDVPADPSAALSAIDSDADFKTYLAKDEAKADLAGYMASMGMINSNVSNKDAVSDILVNGFDNDNLVGMMGQATGN